MVGSRPCWLALEGSGSHWPYVGIAPPFQTQQDFPLPWGSCSQPIKKDLPVNGIQTLALIQGSVGCSSLHRAPGTHGGVAGPGEGGTPSLAPGGSGGVQVCWAPQPGPAGFAMALAWWTASNPSPSGMNTCGGRFKFHILALFQQSASFHRAETSEAVLSVSMGVLDKP